jgi:DNA polymerase-3 subunit alpha
MDKVQDFILYCLNLFGDDFYIECAPSTAEDQMTVNMKLYQIAQMFRIKMVVGTDAHYLTKEDRAVHKGYLNSKNGEREIDSFYEFAHLMDSEEIEELLSPCFPYGFVDKILDNTLEMQDKIEQYSLFHKQDIPRVEVKKYPKNIPWSIDSESCPNLTRLAHSDDDQDRYWVNQCLESLEEKNLITDDRYITELEEEARVKTVISEKLETNMFRYPNTLQHYIDMIWDCGSMVGAGRGSSCAALNHYLMGITQLDPIEWDLPFFRYLNDERVELGDIDIDICPSKRPLILQRIKEERSAMLKRGIAEWAKKALGCTLIATFGTEGTKSAVLTACRGYRSEDYPDGIDIDEAQYMSSLIPEERGFLWPIKDVVNGNPEKNRRPISVFVREVNNYPGLLDIIMSIEGLVNKRSSHASGVILFDGDPFEHSAFMKTPKGEVITQFDLHNAEYMGLTKYDFLVTEVQDKLVQTIQLLQADNLIDPELKLREVYDKYFHPNVLPLQDQKIWDALSNVSVINTFQFDSQVGAQAAKMIRPQNVLEMADANGLMRLTGEEGEERPMVKYCKYKKDISLWYKEMDNFGLTKEEQKTIEPYFKQSYGVPPSQEQLMRMLMDKDICGFSLGEANAARKIVGKKQMSKIPELKAKVLSKATSKKLGEYIWKYGAGPQMGYSFSVIHALAYSFIGVQTLFIATNWDPIYWNTACLIVNSGATDPENAGQTDYGKIAKAMGEIINAGINLSLVNINHSDFGFKPDAENHRILYGMKAMLNVGDDIIEATIKNRPYVSPRDFLNKVHPGKQAMISLIKGGAFDDMMDRRQCMGWYIWETCDKKKRLTLQNLPGLIRHNLLPEDTDERVMARRIYEFNRYLKAMCRPNKAMTYYTLDDRAFNFLSEIEMNDLITCDGLGYYLDVKAWDKYYQSWMDVFRVWIAADKEAILDELNSKIFMDDWQKYAKGTISAWEMEALCFYYHEHELAHVNNTLYGFSDFFKLPENPVVERTFIKGGKTINIFKLNKICGTCIAKNKAKSTVTLLTTSGVVNVKFRKEYFALFDKQISVKGDDGVKHVVEKSWFNRGNMIVVMGIRSGDDFISKKYASSGGHQLYKIDEIYEDGRILLRDHRYQGDLEEE